MLCSVTFARKVGPEPDEGNKKCLSMKGLDIPSIVKCLLNVGAVGEDVLLGLIYDVQFWKF